jgi:hypothetical protein
VREPHLDDESAARAEPYAEAGVVRSGDRADNGQAEAVAVRMARTVGGEPAIAIGAIAGLLPALRAARMSPTQPSR